MTDNPEDQREARSVGLLATRVQLMELIQSVITTQVALAEAVVLKLGVPNEEATAITSSIRETSKLMNAMIQSLKKETSYPEDDA